MYFKPRLTAQQQAEVASIPQHLKDSIRKVPFPSRLGSDSDKIVWNTAAKIYNEAIREFCPNSMNSPGAGKVILKLTTELESPGCYLL
jgi:hypothetical protein